MSEFSTEVSLLATPDQASLREARAEIEDALGDVSVGVETAGASASAAGDSRIAGRERAMSRQLLTDQTNRLGTITDHLDRGLDLDETRNDLLRDLLEETESGNFSQAKGGGGLGGLGAIGGIFAGILGGVGLGASSRVVLATPSGRSTRPRRSVGWTSSPRMSSPRRPPSQRLTLSDRRPVSLRA
ncbi:hypothetical protein ACFQL0_21655 [Haloplanus litoreus]|uniref:hypothetical protein n=1 Tax=Haloplanus litoreus TaxID=767515 RepID=UPI00360CA9D6